MAIKRVPRMNRVYITGRTEKLAGLLRDLHARRETQYPPCQCGNSCHFGPKCMDCGAELTGETVYWLPLHMESRLRAAIKTEAEYQANIAAELAEWEKAKAVIPSDYRTRHGAMYGGTVSFSGESIAEPGITAPRIPWERLAYHETRVRDLTGQSSINGRVRDSQTLYRAQVADGRYIYRIAHYGSFGDDMRETYYLPEDLWQQMMIAEIAARNITPENASEWLAQYRGCVGTELYEFAATFQPAPKLIP
jgi:hypothetical protein